MDKTYEFHIEEDEFEDVELLEDAEKMLSVIYTDYLATEEERKVILAKEKEIESKREIIKQEKYPADFLQKRNLNTIKENDIVKEQVLTIVKKEKLHIRILNKIKRLLGLIK